MSMRGRYAANLSPILARKTNSYTLFVQAIKLRIRTDKYDGFRNYAEIRRVMAHELTHNVWSDHDNNVCSIHLHQTQERSIYSHPSSKSSTLSSTARLPNSKLTQQEAHIPCWALAIPMNQRPRRTNNWLGAQMSLEAVRLLEEVTIPESLDEQGSLRRRS